MNVRTEQAVAFPDASSRPFADPDGPARPARMRSSVLLMFALALLLIVLLAASVFVSAGRYRAEQRWLLHTYQVREQILHLTTGMQRAEMEARNYGLTGDTTAFGAYWRSMGAVDHDTEALAALVADNPVQSADTATLRRVIDGRRARYEQILADFRARGPSAAHADVIALVSGMQHPVDDVTTRMLRQENDLLKSREAAGARQERGLKIAAGVAVGGSLLLLVGAFISIALEQHRRARGEQALARNARRLEQALEETRRARDTLRHLSTLAELLQNCRDLDEAIVVVDRALPPLLPSTSGALALVNASRNIVEARTHWGACGAVLGEAVFAPEDCWALRRGQLHAGGAQQAAPLCPHLVHAGAPEAYGVCLPLNSQGRVVGVLTLCTPEPLAPEASRLASAVADQLALALANLQLQATLRTQSIRDPLTNLFNRRYLEASMPRELVRARRRNGSLSVLMFDLDHFKRYNDTQGHDAGDALLGAFATLLIRSSRGDDIPCRFGGEEFMLVLTDANHAHALARAEEIRGATANLVVNYRSGVLPPATVSIGVASFPEHGDSPETLVRVADQALYRAKRQGRNLVVSAAEVADRDNPEPQPAPTGA